MKKRIGIGAGAVVAGLLIPLCIVWFTPASKDQVFGDLAHWPLRAGAWGTVGQWIASILTAGSLLLAISILLRDSRKDEKDHIVKVTCWIDAGNLSFINKSELPIVRPVVHLVPKPRREIDRLIKKLDPVDRPENVARDSQIPISFSFQKDGGTKTYQPEEQGERGWFYPRMHLSLYDCVLVFDDALAVTWGRRVPGGEVLRASAVEELLARKRKLADGFLVSKEYDAEELELRRDKTKEIEEEATRE
jgi:hypothetical protein